MEEKCLKDRSLTLGTAIISSCLCAEGTQFLGTHPLTRSLELTMELTGSREISITAQNISLFSLQSVFVCHPHLVDDDGNEDRLNQLHSQESEDQGSD